MRKVVIEHLNKLKVQILDAAVWLPETERAEFFSDLADWAYSQYETLSVNGEDEIQQNEE